MKKINIVFRPADLYFSLYTNSKLLLDYFYNVYGEMIVEEKIYSSEILIVIENVKEFTISYPNGDVSTTNNFETILLWTNRFIKRNYKNETYWSFHGGLVMSRSGHGIIVCGRSGSGKSTLCAHMIENGYFCSGDDIIWIHQENWSMIPMPVSINLRNDAIEKSDLKTSKLTYWFPDIDGDRRWVIRTKKLTGKTPNIRSVVHVHYNEEYNSIKKLDTMHSIKVAITNSYLATKMQTNHEMAAKMVRKFDFYSLYHTSSQNGIRQIVNLLN